MTEPFDVSTMPPLADLLPPEDDLSGATPAMEAGGLPTALPAPSPSFFHIHSVRAGCWLISFRPVGAPLIAFDGTMRVESHSDGRTASGDLYQRPVKFLPIPPFPPRP